MVFEPMFTGLNDTQSKEKWEDYQTRVARIFDHTRPAEKEMFIPRNDISDKTSKKPIDERLYETLKLTRSQILLYGDSGVGKTNLILNQCKKLGLKSKLINVSGKQTFSELMSDLLIDLSDGEFSQDSSVTKSTGASHDQTMSASVSGYFSGAQSKQDRQDVSVTKRTEVRSLNRQLYKLLAENGYYVLIIDNVHNLATLEDRSAMGGLMEFFYDAVNENPDLPIVPRITAAGIATSGADLIGNDSSRERRIEQIFVPHMTSDQTKQIASTGFDKLGLSYDEAKLGPLDRIAFYSDGYPFFAQQICRNTAMQEQVFDAKKVFAKDVETAISQISVEDSDSIDRLLEKAQPKQTKVRLRTLVLRVIAQQEWPSWTSRNVVDVLEEDPSSVATRQSNVTAELNKLYKEFRILSRTGDHVFNYKFRNPHFRPYIRMRIVDL